MKARSRSRGSTESEPPSQSVASAVGFLSPRGGVAARELDSQATAIDQVCTALGLRVVELIREEDATNGASAERPSLERALGQVEAGEVSCLVVHDLQQLSQSVDELASVIDRLERSGARLVALDVGLDTASSSGRLALERRPGGRPDTAVYAPEPAEPAEPEPVEATPLAAPAVLANQALAYSTAESEEAVEAIQRRCADLGLEVVEIIREVQVEGKALDRPGLSGLIERIAAGQAGCLVVGSLGQLSHSVAELGAMVNWLERNRIRLVTVDLELDTASSGGRLTVRALASVAGLQRDRLSQRTRKGLAAAQTRRAAAAEAASGGTGTGSGWPEVSKRIAAMRQDGMTLQAIADVLNAEGVPTPRGGAQWRPSSVQTAAGYKRRSRAKKADELPPVQRPPSGP